MELFPAEAVNSAKSNRFVSLAVAQTLEGEIIPPLLLAEKARAMIYYPLDVAFQSLKQHLSGRSQKRPPAPPLEII